MLTPGVEMKRLAIVVLAMCAVSGRLSYAGEERPSWVTPEKLSILKTIGIDPITDLDPRGNYRWRYRAKRPLVVKPYSCPAESIVALSKTIDLILPPRQAPCTGPGGENFDALKLLPNGSVEPLS